MAAAALYILTGLTLYGGAHHLYLGARRPDGYPHLQLGGLYLLVAGFALGSALTYELGALEALLPAGKLDITLGILLWVGLVWHVAFRTGCKPLIVLDLLTAIWAIFLVRNLAEPNSLLYADVTPVKQTLLSGETLGLFFTSISPWWTAVELTMLASLAFCFYACYNLYQRRQRTLALVTAAGLALLGLVTLFDHLVSIQVIRAGYLTPFGFALFLLPESLYPLVGDWRKRRGSVTPPVVYNLTYMPDQATFHSDVSQLRTPLQGGARKRADNGSGRRVTPDHEAPRVNETPAKENARIRTVVDMSISAAPAPGARSRPAAAGQPVTAIPPPPVVDPVILTAVTDNLIDIAVYATMALNRFKRGDADPQTLESLCKKVRSHAIKTRRLAAQLVPADKSDRDDAAGSDD
jgi:hypothetical protein